MASNHSRADKYDQAIVDKVCVRMAGGESLRAIAKNLGCKERTVRDWFYRDRHGCYADYTRARDMQADCHADMIVDACKDVCWQASFRQIKRGLPLTVSSGLPASSGRAFTATNWSTG